MMVEPEGGVRWVIGGVLVAVGLVILLAVRSAGRSSARSRAVWSPDNKIRAALAGVTMIVAGLLFLMGGVGS